jgi:D-3-phosphoglycerate dehydrogenase
VCVRHEIATAALMPPRDDIGSGHCEERRDEAISLQTKAPFLMTRPKVLLTNAIHPAGMRILQEKTDVIVAADVRPETLRSAVPDAEALVVRSQLPEDIFDHAPRLRGVVRHGAGVDMIPVEAATRARIPVANVPGVNAEAVAEYCVSGMLLLVRNMHRIDHTLRETDWNVSRKIADDAVELFGRTVGIVGVGHVGARVAQICSTAFRMRVLGHQRRLNALPECVTGVTLDTLFSESDFIVLSCPLTRETRGMIDRTLIGRMKKTAGLINVSRGPVVDEAALVGALREQRIRGAVLDVYTEQPLPRDHPLLGLDNAILTPHAAGITQESMQRMSEGAVQEVLRMLAGERPLNLINPDAWPARTRARS